MTRPSLADPVMANRWQVKAHLDDNTCDPCRNNSTKIYKNRADAHKDYPGGRGFKDCVGAKYGNKCRCTVVKRRKGGTNEMTPEELANLNQRIRTQSETMSARAFAPPLPDGASAPTEKLTMRAAEAADDGSGATQIYLYDYIGGWDGVKAADVALMLAGLTGPVDLHINSGGGSIFEGVAIYNQLVAYDRNKGAVTTYIDSLAASAASFIALAGREVVCEATATLMTHDGQGGAIGTADMLREVADLLDMLSNTIAGIYAKKTGTPAADWRETMRDGDTWYTAAAALEAGLVDRVANGDDPDTDDGDTSNVLDLDIFNTWAQNADPLADVDIPTAIVPPEPPAPEAPTFTLTADALEGFRTQMKEVLA